MQNVASLRDVNVQSESPANVFWNVDKGQMEQVLINVVKNAIEVCSSGQQVRINVTPDSILIRNNGKPIDPDVSTKLFNPFFSTKRDGQGIGLTLTREILGNHGFAFALETGQDGWTEFRIEKS
jgi:signal transduction histidine kinase